MSGRCERRVPSSVYCFHVAPGLDIRPAEALTASGQRPVEVAHGMLASELDAYLIGVVAGDGCGDTVKSQNCRTLQTRLTEIRIRFEFDQHALKTG